MYRKIIQQQILLTQHLYNSADPQKMLQVSVLHQTQDTSRKGWQNLSLTVPALKHPE